MPSQPIGLTPNAYIPNARLTRVSRALLMSRHIRDAEAVAEIAAQAEIRCAKPTSD
jgi:hypothetical protein